MVGKMDLKAFVCGIALCGILASCAGPLDVGPRPEGSREQRLVSLYFSAEAWGGVPFTETQKQQAMVASMLGRKNSGLEHEVAHVLDTPGVQVRRFAAVYEVDGSARPPALTSGYELELLVPYSEDSLKVELVNDETGVTNLVRVVLDGH
jgi:hypothetical protein